MPKTRKKPRSSKKKRAWYRKVPTIRRFVLWNLVWWTLGIAGLVGGVLYTEHVVRPVAEGGGTSFSPLQIFQDETVGKRVFGNEERLNILVVGIDYNYNDQGILYTKGARTDTIIVLSLSREASFFNIVSIPRDTQVMIAEDIGYDKINSAYSYGGIEQTRETVSEFLGIPIHHHVILKVSGAKDVVDALGGLPVDVEKNMDYDDNWGKLHIHLKKGPQILDGEQAVGYARFRMDEEGDRGRIRRQQQVVRALGRKLKEPALLSRLNELSRVINQNIETDLQLLPMIDLANLYSSFDFAKMRNASIVGDDAVDTNGTSYIVPYEPENRRTVRRLLQNLKLLRKDDLRIRIFFKKAPSYLAHGLSDRLYEAGFRGVQVEALPWESEEITETTRLVWFNEVPRLKSVLHAVVGDIPSTNETLTQGRDEDLAIFLGDEEEGQWKEIPERLLQEREPEINEDDTETEDEQGSEENKFERERPHIRYQPEFTPLQLPPAKEDLTETYSPDGEQAESSEPIEIEYSDLEPELVQSEAPRVRDSDPPVEIPVSPRPEEIQEIQTESPLPQEVELDLESPLPLATPINPE